MKSILFLILGLIVLGGIFLAFKPSPITTTNAEPQTFEIVIKDQQIISGPNLIKVTEGTPVTIKLTIDMDEELHLHGYDKSVELKKDTPAQLSFIAEFTGRFPYELEHSKIEIGTLEVSPK